MKKPYIVGIAGGSASGKTTFSEKLEEKLAGHSLKLIHTDHYFKPADQRPVAPGPITGIDYLDDNHPNTLNWEQFYTDLNAILEEGYDFVVIEGLMVLWNEKVLPLLDLKLFVDCKPDERIVRRLRRNMGFGLDFDEIANVYLDLVRYRHDEYVEPSKWQADFILNGSNFSDIALQVICDLMINSIS